MKVNTRYGEDQVPKKVVTDNACRCHFCNKKMPKKTTAIWIAVNSGPTGGVYICLKHAKQLAEELLALL
jgi:hypothetical protein